MLTVKTDPLPSDTQNPLKKCRVSQLLEGVIKEITMSKRSPPPQKKIFWSKTRYVTVLGLKKCKKKVTLLADLLLQVVSGVMILNQSIRKLNKPSLILTRHVRC